MSAPNQKKIYIERSSDKAKKDYLKVSNQSLKFALYNLKPSAFKLWIYFADNSNGYVFDLYPVDFCNKANLSKTTYQNAWKELEEYGYIKRSNKKKNIYLFREISDSDKIKDPDKDKDIVQSVEGKEFEEIKKQYFNF